MATPFTYEYHNTFIHRLNPIARFLFFSSFMVLGSLFIDPLIKVPLILILVLFLIIAKLNLKAYQTILIVSFVGLLIGRSYIALFMVDANYFKVYPAAWVTTVILELTPSSFPVFGRTAITYGGLLYWFTEPLTVVLIILAVAGLQHTTSMSEIVSILSKLRMPFPIIFITTVTLRFIPEYTERIKIVQRAQILRGWSLETRNPIKRITLLGALLIPVMRYLVSSTDVMTMSSSNRALGLGPVTPTFDFRFNTLDRAISIGSILLMVIGLYALFAFNIGNI
jgi:energy-coupling factor transporter transmembrane protein EcfT